MPHDRVERVAPDCKPCTLLAFHFRRTLVCPALSRHRRHTHVNTPGGPAIGRDTVFGAWRHRVTYRITCPSQDVQYASISSVRQILAIRL